MSRDRADALMSTSYTGNIPEPLRPQGPFQFCLGKIPAPGGPLMRTF